MYLSVFLLGDLGIDVDFLLALAEAHLLLKESFKAFLLVESLRT